MQVNPANHVLRFEHARVLARSLPRSLALATDAVADHHERASGKRGVEENANTGVGEKRHPTGKERRGDESTGNLDGGGPLLPSS